MQRTCRNDWCKQTFEVTNDDLAFLDRVSPVFAGKNYSLPPPTLCPDCRLQRRTSHANESKIWRRKSSKSGKEIISAVSPDHPHAVYDRKEWLRDDWDPMSYGKKVDATRPIFDQLKEMFVTVPIMSLVDDDNENSEYVQYTGWCKNCYLCFCVEYSEDCLYCHSTYYSKNAVDAYGDLTLELCYECILCKDCYHVLYSKDCANCSNSAFLVDCLDCKDCFACAGLRRKQFCFFNEQLTKDEYEKRIAAFPLSKYSTVEVVWNRSSRRIRGESTSDSTMSM